ncbi:OPT/YSL family transporter, partial [bacterium]|nr:OPT/YSL family transporter [bacterium]
PALEMIRANKGLEPLSYGSLVIWAISIAFLGVHFAVPLRKQMVVVEKLRYPTGLAAAETIKAMYASGAEALKKTKVLLWAGIAAAVIKLLYLIEPTGLHVLEDFSFNDIGLWSVAVLGLPLYSIYIGINLSPMMFGAGILIGPKVGWSLFGGAILAWGIIVPILLNSGIVEIAPNMKKIEQSLTKIQVAETAGVTKGVEKAKREYEREAGEAIRRAEVLAKHRDDATTLQILVAMNAPGELLRTAGMQPADENRGAPVIRKELPTETNPYKAGFAWVLWTGVALMITSSFTSLAMQYKTIIKTFSSLTSAAKSSVTAADEDDEPDAPDPYPMKYWIVGMTLATVLTATLAQIYFAIPVYMGIIAVILSLLIAAIAVRATGETDINPVGAMGKITQVVYGAMAPGKMMVNLMAAAITSAGASQAGDLMHDLKAGYMLKVSIRKQVITQLIGVVVGVFAAAGAYRVLTAVYEIPGEEFPGPAVFAWYKMAEVLAVGFDALPEGAMWGAGVGAALGILLPILGRNKKIGKWLPSPVAFGIAFMVHAQYSIGMWLGAVITQQWAKKNSTMVEKYGASLASGLIAGEGLMMVGFALYLMLTQVIL